LTDSQSNIGAAVIAGIGSANVKPPQIRWRGLCKPQAAKASLSVDARSTSVQLFTHRGPGVDRQRPVH